MTEKELILTHILECQRSDLYLDEPLLNKKQSDRLEEILFLRKQAQPLQYILGECEFMGLSFKVNEDVFIPRPETEILVERVIRLIADCRLQIADLDILDLGTGSGCIAISLAKFLLQARITAVDISEKALKIAQSNAQLNNVSEKIEFIRTDLFPISNLPCLPAGRQSPIYNIIVSNPPYVPTSEIGNLQPEIRYEPHIALDSGVDGLDFCRRIINESPKYLEDNGFLIMEMGFGQCYAIRNMFQESGNFEIIDIVRDYSDIERVIIVQLK